MHLNQEVASPFSEIDVLGWPELETDQEQVAWIEEHSNHAMLYGEVMEG